MVISKDRSSAFHNDNLDVVVTGCDALRNRTVHKIESINWNVYGQSYLIPPLFSTHYNYLLHTMLYLKRSSIVIFCVASFLFISCKTSTSPTDNGSALTGTLLYDIPSAESEVGTYSFASQHETVIFKGGSGPSWMPNGEILYEEPSDVSPAVNWKIITSASNGTNRKVLLDSKMFSLNVNKSPKMSKDGSTICFNYWLKGGSAADIYTGHATLLMKSDGTLIGGIDSLFDGSWMPNGSLVLSATVDELYGEKTFYADGLYMLSADMTKITEIGSGIVKPKHPAVSPDGKRIAFAMNGHIWIINSDGTGLRQVTTGSKEEKHPCWSPDGKNIACSCYGTFEVTYFNAIAVVPADNAAAIELTNESSYWVKDPSQSTNSGYGRVTPYSSISWK